MGYAPLRDGSLVCPRRAAPQGSEASLRMLTEAAPTGGGRTSPEKLPATIEQLNISAEEAATCAAEDECCDVSSDLDDSAAVAAAVAAVEAKRAAIVAAVVAARLAHKNNQGEQQRKERKAKATDFFSAGEVPLSFGEEKRNQGGEKVKDYRQQGEYGMKKFIKP